VSMRGGWTMVASPARPTYIYARGVSPLWLARVRRLLTEHSSNGDVVEPTIDADAWRQMEQWGDEPSRASGPSEPRRAIAASEPARRVPRFRALPAEAEGA
jgi:hypothetical protein